MDDLINMLNQAKTVIVQQSLVAADNGQTYTPICNVPLSKEQINLLIRLLNKEKMIHIIDACEVDDGK